MKLNIKKGIEAVMIFGTCMMLHTSCTRDFEEINKNPLYPDKEAEQWDGVLNSAYLPDLQKNVIAVGTAADRTDFVNKYQVAFNLAGDSWAGYHSPRDAKWEGGTSFSNFFFPNNWVNNTFGWMVTDVFAPWMQLRKITMTDVNPNKEMFALAQISKIMALHRTTDMFGPIPYSKVGSGNFKVAYDSQQSVYQSFFKELEEAVETLTAFYGAGNVVVPFTKDADVVYEGDVEKWIRLANSLMLRLAIRVRFADEGLAREYAVKAVEHPIGVIENPSQAAKMDKGAGLQMRHSLIEITENYNDTRMGATIQCYLKGYGDPRLQVYFKPGASNTFDAVRAGIPSTGNSYNDYAIPNVKETTPTYWMKASEVFFLKAEAALAGFDMGGKTPKYFYEKGIEMSFEENEVNIGSYLGSTSQPDSYTDRVKPEYSSTAPGSVTVAWDEAMDMEHKLEKIITQKYLAIYPDGHEAWSEWRRTGYPRQIPPVVNLTNKGVMMSDGYKDGVRRMPYPRAEYDNNIENLQKAISEYLGGMDNAATNVWWDKKPKK